MNKELLYQVALTLIPGMGSVHAKILSEHFKSAEAIFKAKKKELTHIEGIGASLAKAIKDFHNYTEAENEIIFCEKHHIALLFLTNTAYPQRLLNCYDSPTLLYYRGNANLNSSKIISIIGTRNNTEYGKQITEQLIADMQQQTGLLIISGLAFGIDGIAHRAALQNNIPTVGILAHGLDTIYPPPHTSLAKEMLGHGGLVTEFRRNCIPDKFHFPRRNRIAAGMSDATIVIETALKGGSMITAELAFNYNRDVFAVPGKTTDPKSGGCLKLIQQNKAILFTNANQLLLEMGWQDKKITPNKQRTLFIELTEDEKIMLEILKEKEPQAIDDIYLKSARSSSAVAAALLNLELQNVVISLPGKMYKLA